MTPARGCVGANMRNFLSFTSMILVVAVLPCLATENALEVPTNSNQSLKFFKPQLSAVPLLIPAENVEYEVSLTPLQGVTTITNSMPPICSEFAEFNIEGRLPLRCKILPGTSEQACAVWYTEVFKSKSWKSPWVIHTAIGAPCQIQASSIHGFCKFGGEYEKNKSYTWKLGNKVVLSDDLRHSLPMDSETPWLGLF